MSGNGRMGAKERKKGVGSLSDLPGPIGKTLPLHSHKSLVNTLLSASLLERNSGFKYYTKWVNIGPTKFCWFYQKFPIFFFFFFSIYFIYSISAETCLFTVMCEEVRIALNSLLPYGIPKWKPNESKNCSKPASAPATNYECNHNWRGVQKFTTRRRDNTTSSPIRDQYFEVGVNTVVDEDDRGWDQRGRGG